MSLLFLPFHREVDRMHQQINLIRMFIPNYFSVMYQEVKIVVPKEMVVHNFNLYQIKINKMRAKTWMTKLLKHLLLTLSLFH